MTAVTAMTAGTTMTTKVTAINRVRVMARIYKPGPVMVKPTLLPMVYRKRDLMRN